MAIKIMRQIIIEMIMVCRLNHRGAKIYMSNVGKSDF